jgi:transcriptional regulator with XRE-family HTH domain
MMNRKHQVQKEKGMKQIQMAEALGVAKSSVSPWCCNTVQSTLAKLNKIAFVVGCDVTDLFVSKKKKNKK